MFSPEVHQEWERLCEECDALKDAFSKAFNIVVGTTRPTSEQWADLDAAGTRLDDCIRRLKEFDKKHL